MKYQPMESTYKDNHIVRRRAVYTALKPVLETNALYQAMWLWEKQYANTQSMRLRSFIAEIVERDLLQGNAHTAYKNLVQCFMQTPSLLAPDPYAEMLKHQDVSYSSGHTIEKDYKQSPSIQRPRETVVFEAVMTSFINAIGKMDSYSIDAIAQNVRNNSPKMDLTRHQKQELLNWIIGRGKNPLSLAFSLSQMSTIINYTYTIACDLIGPVKSDHYLSTAIATANQLPEAKEFPPQHLL